MAKITKPLRTVAFKFASEDMPVISDTEKEPLASSLLAQFLRKDTMAFSSQGATSYAPFHAVSLVHSQITPTEVDRPDPYGCEDGGGDQSKSDTVCKGEADEMTLRCTG